MNHRDYAWPKCSSVALCEKPACSTSLKPKPATMSSFMSGLPLARSTKKKRREPIAYLKKWVNSLSLQRQRSKKNLATEVSVKYVDEYRREQLARNITKEI